MQKLEIQPIPVAEWKSNETIRPIFLFFVKHESNVSLYDGLQLNGPGSIHSGQQASSTLQLQQRHESSFDDRHKPSVLSTNDAKPPLSSVGQTSAVPTGEALGGQKVGN